MEASTFSNLLGAGTKRLTSTKRATRRKPIKNEVVSNVKLDNLSTPDFGCDLNFFQDGQDGYEEPMETPISFQEKELLLSKAQKQLNDLPSLIIENISYSIYSFEELQELAEFKVTKNDDSGIFSINDTRSGVIDSKKACSVCFQDNLHCPGHLGIIELEQMIIHPMMIKETARVLSSVCNSCGGLLITEEELENKGLLNLSGPKRLKLIAEASKGLPCRRRIEEEGVIDCVANPTYVTSKVSELGKMIYSYNPKDKDSFNFRSVEDVLQILQGISQEDAKLLGFSESSHPERFIMRALPVIPLCSRAPVNQDGMILQDHISMMYKDIVKWNNFLKKGFTGKDAESNRDKVVRSLIFSVSHLLDNSDGRYSQGDRGVYTDIKMRIQGKDAIIRSFLMGKRVNFSARTVLGPDPSLKFGQIRIPKVMAPKLTRPEKVTPSNISRLTQLFLNGRVTHLISHSGNYQGIRRKVKDKLRDQYSLAYGDTVWRWLQNGDYVVFNRQPTLHKQGIMGHEVVLGDPKTIGLHLSSTTPFNADFDGDEGALHVAQDLLAIAEMEEIMGIKKCIMNAQTNKNIIGVIFDALAAAYLLTQYETTIDRDVFNDIILFLEKSLDISSFFERLDKYGVPHYSGRAVFSALLPDDFYYRKGEVLIKDGVLITGTISKDHIGTTHGSIIQVLMKDYGERETTDFLTDIYRTMDRFILSRGFSVGLDDCFLQGKDSDLAISYEIEKARMLVKSMGWKLEDPLEEERREKQIRAYLDTAKSFGQKLSIENLSPDNSFNVMARSGAKGSTFNIAQITGILGQQYLRGQRMPETLSGGRRCLPYFPQDSIDPEARGFCINSFLTGLTPAELFFHQAASREGLVDTAITTADTGFLHRKIVKALEDVKVFNDGSVRNAIGTIYQFTYGSDGFDAGHLETVNTKSGTFAGFINMKRLAAKLNTKYGYVAPGEPETVIVRKRE